MYKLPHTMTLIITIIITQHTDQIGQLSDHAVKNVTDYYVGLMKARVQKGVQVILMLKLLWCLCNSFTFLCCVIFTLVAIV